MKRGIARVLVGAAMAAALLLPESASAAEPKRPTSESQKVQLLMSEFNHGA